MIAPGSWPASAVGDRLRRITGERTAVRRRIKLLLLTLVAASPAAVTAIAKPPPLLVWNASSSAPVGLYAVRRGAPPRRGDMVIAWAPGPARALAAARRYLPASVPLVKPVAAVSGERVCALGPTIFIDGRAVAKRLRSDPSGRPMPWWSGCRLLGRGELFLLSGNVPEAFDGRYFGITATRLVIGRTALLWRR
jgi:conjugative transfer signal peptidase TraF